MHKSILGSVAFLVLSCGLASAHEGGHTPLRRVAEHGSPEGVLALVGLVLLGLAMRRRLVVPLGFGLLLVGCAGAIQTRPAGPEDEKLARLAQKHFEAFAGRVGFRFDGTYFYVESDGLPDHRMMVGITAWQQQVPLPQAYSGRNAWAIPLHPRLADNPVSARTALFRGAIALAVNGVPIFNPIKNDGKTDTFLAGELDEFGGHCGKGDDYHYHTAPVHLEKVVGKGNPIGYALDGYPLYGYTDATGTEPTDLDEFNGRMEAGAYRYYSTRKYPYVNGGLRGEVLVRGDQIEPQPKANPIRPEGRPLPGAKITGFSRDEVKKTTELKYELGGATYTIRTTIQADGRVRFAFTDPAGTERVETVR